MKDIVATNHSGFTLIEISAVIAIIGLLAGAAVLSLAHTVDNRSFEMVCRELEQADCLVRSAARQSGHSEQVIFDLDRGQVMWQVSPDEKAITLIRLGTDDSIQIRTPEESVNMRQIAVRFSSLGCSESYALGLSKARQNPRWMIVAGLSGQIFWADDEKQLNTLFQSLAKHSLQVSARLNPD